LIVRVTIHGEVSFFHHADNHKTKVCSEAAWRFLLASEMRSCEFPPGGLTVNHETEAPFLPWTTALE